MARQPKPSSSLMALGADVTKEVVLPSLSPFQALSAILEYLALVLPETRALDCSPLESLSDQCLASRLRQACDLPVEGDVSGIRHRRSKALVPRESQDRAYWDVDHREVETRAPLSRLL